MIVESFSNNASISGPLRGSLVIGTGGSPAATAGDTTALASPGTAADAATSVAVPETRPSNMLSRNFFDLNYQRSKYVDAGIDSLRQEQDFSSKMNSLVSGLVSQALIWDAERQFGGAVPIENTYVNGQRLAIASYMATDRIKSDETSKHSERNLDEIREEIDRKSEEAAATDENENAPTEETKAQDTDDVTPESESAGEQTENSGPAIQDTDLMDVDEALIAPPAGTEIDITV